MCISIHCVNDFQKTYTVSILDKKRSKNEGQLPKYYVESSQDPIISRDAFLRVQAEMVRRANLLTDGKKRVYSSRYALSSTVYCAHCGDIFRRINWNNRGKKSTVWRCVSRVEKGVPECTARTVSEKALKDAVATAVNDAWARRDTFIPVLKENIRAGMEDTTDRRLAEIDEAIRDKQTDLAEYSEKLVRRLVEKITIYDEKITVEFKSGLIIDVDA